MADAQHAHRPQRLQRHAAMDAEAAGQLHDPPQHDDRHAADALPGRRRLLQTPGRGDREGHARDQGARRDQRRAGLEVDRARRRHALRTGRRDRAARRRVERPRLPRRGLALVEDPQVRLGLRPNRARHQGRHRKGTLAPSGDRTARYPRDVHEGRADLLLQSSQVPRLPRRQDGQGGVEVDRPGGPVGHRRAPPGPAGHVGIRHLRLRQVRREGAVFRRPTADEAGGRLDRQRQTPLAVSGRGELPVGPPR